MVIANKKIAKRLMSFISAIVIIGIVIAVANIFSVRNLVKKCNEYNKIDFEEQLVPQIDDNGNWVFTTDRDFKVMHLTDIHLGGGFLSKGTDEMTLNAVAAMVTREKPDLVIATGDIAFPVPYMAGTFNNKSGAKAFANLMESLGVYWSVTFGNHDAESYSYFDREAISEFYSDDEFKYCLFNSGPQEVDGYGNSIIEVKNTKGIITQAFVLMDSHAYVDDGIITSINGEYDNIHQNQVDWYESEIKRMNEENQKLGEKETVKTLAFFHIPLVEMNDAWTEFQENEFRDTKNFKYIEGIIGETGRRVYCGLGEDGLFEKMVELGSTKAIFNGHDHYNNTTFEYKGIQFSYGYSIDYFAYSGIAEEGSQRGCTLITCKPDTTFNIEKFNYYSDRYDLDGFEREEVTMQFEDVKYQVEEDKQ